VDPVNELFKDDTTTTITVEYLALKPGVNSSVLLSELYYRNKEGHSYADITGNKQKPEILARDSNGKITSYKIDTNLPIFKNKQGKRLMLDKND